MRILTGSAITGDIAVHCGMHDLRCKNECTMQCSAAMTKQSPGGFQESLGKRVSNGRALCQNRRWRTQNRIDATTGAAAEIVKCAIHAT